MLRHNLIAGKVGRESRLSTSPHVPVAFSDLLFRLRRPSLQFPPPMSFVDVPVGIRIDRMDRDVAIQCTAGLRNSTKTLKGNR